SGAAMIGGGGIFNTATISILSGSCGESGNAFGFVTYDSSIPAVRMLTSAEYANSITSGASVLNNASLSSNQVVNAATTINSLLLQNNGGVSGTGTLTINSGLINVQPAVGPNAGISVATLALGDGIVRTP